MAITILDKSPSTQSAVKGVPVTLFVRATSDTGSLTYQWYTNAFKPQPVIISGATSSTYSVPTTDTLQAGYKVVINGTVEEYFKFIAAVPWLAGLGDGTQVVPIHNTNATVLAKNIRGSLHIYDNYDELKAAFNNYERIQAGQIAYVLHDVPAINPTTGLPQTQTIVNKYYKCQVEHPYSKKDYIDNVTAPAYVKLRENAKYWYQEPGDVGAGVGASAKVLLDNDGFITGIEIINGGELYEDGTTVIGLSSNENVDMSVFQPVMVIDDYEAYYSNNQAIPAISILTPQVGPFTIAPEVLIFSGTISYHNLPPAPSFRWTVSETPDPTADWVGVTFLNAEPDNDTIIIENGLVKANIPKPYNPVTLSLTAQNVGFVNTVLLNEVSTTITIKNIHVYADNFANICANTLGASSITLSAITSDGTQSIMSSLGSITKASLSQGFGNLSVTIDKTGLNQNHTVTIIAAATEVGEDNARTHVVTASTQIQWCYNKYYLKDSNEAVQGTITIPNSAGRELSFDSHGVYNFPYTVTPQYLWVILPVYMNITHIGKADENVPFYSDLDNTLVATNITIVKNGQSQSYKGYRSYWPTAADHLVTI